MLFALGVMTNLSQSLDGPFDVLEVITSTTSPLFSLVLTVALVGYGELTSLQVINKLVELYKSEHFQENVALGCV